MSSFFVEYKCNYFSGNIGSVGAMSFKETNLEYLWIDRNKMTGVIPFQGSFIYQITHTTYICTLKYRITPGF